MLPRCPRGERRNKQTRLCERCPVGTVRVRGKCVTNAAPVPDPDPVPYPYQTLPPKSRCPPRYHKDPNPPHNCHSCLNDDVILSHVSGMCHPYVEVPPTASGSCPRGTRRKRGKCIRVIGNVNAPATARTNQTRSRDPYPRPSYLPTAYLSVIERLLTRFQGNERHRTIAKYVLSAGDLRILDVRVKSLEYVNGIMDKIQWDQFENDTLFGFCTDMIFILNRYPPLPNPANLYKLFAICIRETLKRSLTIADVNDADRIIRHTIPRLTPRLVHELNYQDQDQRDENINTIHEALRDCGAFYTDSGKIYLIPVAFMTPSVVHLNRTRVTRPNTMMDLEEFDDIPFDPTRANHICIIIEDGTHLNAFSVPTYLLRKGINPRTPAWLYMKCRASTHSLSINDAQVHASPLYHNLGKLGLPQSAYVDIREIKTALDKGHTLLVLKPKRVDGSNLVTQIASAYLYKVPQNVVGSSHCEVGHVGGMYDVFVE